MLHSVFAQRYRSAAAGRSPDVGRKDDWFGSFFTSGMMAFKPSRVPFFLLQIRAAPRTKVDSDDAAPAVVNDDPVRLRARVVVDERVGTFKAVGVHVALLA